MGFPVMGADPGVEGGLAILRGDGTIVHLRAFQPSMTRADMNNALRLAAQILRAEGGNVAFLEKVGHRPTDGGQGGFTFGRVYGWIEIGLTAHGIVVKDVYPQMWQAKLDCMTAGNKNVSKRKAMELWPHEKWTHAVADAALIAEYGRRRLML